MVKIVAMGDNVVDCYLGRDTMFPGGNCLNVAAFVSQIGGQAAYIGAIGQDKAGEAIRRALVAEKVDISHLRRLNGASAYCVIGHRGSERVFVRFNLGVSMFEPSKDDFDFLDDFDSVHIGQSSGLDAHLSQAQAHAPLSYDFSDKYDAEKITKIAPLCFLASFSSRQKEKDYALDLLHMTLDRGAKYCLVTRGENGAILGFDQEIFEVAPERIEPVDTLGAGDSFIARTLFGIIEGEKPHILLRQAAKLAAQTCGHYGAFGHGVSLDPKFKQIAQT